MHYHHRHRSVVDLPRHGRGGSAGQRPSASMVSVSTNSPGCTARAPRAPPSRACRRPILPSTGAPWRAGASRRLAAPPPPALIDSWGGLGSPAGAARAPSAGQPLGVTLSLAVTRLHASRGGRSQGVARVAGWRAPQGLPPSLAVPRGGSRPGLRRGGQAARGAGPRPGSDGRGLRWMCWISRPASGPPPNSPGLLQWSRCQLVGPRGGPCLQNRPPRLSSLLSPLRAAPACVHDLSGSPH